MLAANAGGVQDNVSMCRLLFAARIAEGHLSAGCEQQRIAFFNDRNGIFNYTAISC